LVWLCRQELRAQEKALTEQALRELQFAKDQAAALVKAQEIAFEKSTSHLVSPLSSLLAFSRVRGCRFCRCR
jgi:hypothetical protein